LTTATSAAARAVAPTTRDGIAAVYGGSTQHHRTLTAPKYARYLTGGLVYLLDLLDTDVTAYAGLVVPERLHAAC